MNETTCEKHPRYHGVRPPKNGCRVCIMVYMNRNGLNEVLHSATAMSNVLYNYAQRFGDLSLREADKMVMRTQQEKWDKISNQFLQNLKP